jgi:hypothetical protein
MESANKIAQPVLGPFVVLVRGNIAAPHAAEHHQQSHVRKAVAGPLA